MRATVLCVAALGLLLSADSTAHAAFGAGECSGGKCGHPDQSGGGPGGGGGGGGGGCGGSILINQTDTGDTYQYADDMDKDGWEDDFDNCPFVPNKAQLDTDGDGIGDACDNAKSVRNVDQRDTDGDGIGDAVDDDIDNDGIKNSADNCPLVPNPTQQSYKRDTLGHKNAAGNACDADPDGDGIPSIKDNCPLVYNPEQNGNDKFKYGAACDADNDGDGIPDQLDNCPTVANSDQKNTFGAAIGGKLVGDACNADIDGDGVLNAVDNCRLVKNPAQKDADNDGRGDVCDAQYCFVLKGMKDETHCLRAEDTFKVLAPDLEVPTGEPVRLRVFANRSAAVHWQFNVDKAPDNSTATVGNPKGTAIYWAGHEALMQRGGAPTFTPDQPGVYRIKLIARLAFADHKPELPRENFYVMTVTATGEPRGGGCSVGGTSSGGGLTPLVLVCLLGLGLWRRRIRVWVHPTHRHRHAR